MTSKRFYYLLIGLIVLLFVGLVAGTYGINTLLTSQSDKLTALKAKSAALAQEQQGLSLAKSDVKKYSSLEQIAQSVVPEDKNQAEAVLEIVNIASQNNIALASITFPASTLGTSTLTPAEDSEVSSTSSASNSESSVNSAENSLSQLLPVSGIPGVYELQITIASDTDHPVQYSSLINFLSALEHNRRTAQISAIDIEPSSANPDLLTFTINLDEYIKP
jgi:hypothetical protein